MILLYHLKATNCYLPNQTLQKYLNNKEKWCPANKIIINVVESKAIPIPGLFFEVFLVGKTNDLSKNEHKF